ncbi:PAS domain-containing sensor histidine kinase [Poseidonocella sp. HB161398]|uniref:hybrid sensor histidine kinase/response regulator n=1 Tax=Poseidonocella sp. HB161398 TaxID=2320855 RepID=UPI0014869B7C|nr:hybrid sensor histidine kinase/response regulator [Poseidonocella sp. HB161398]
MGACGDHPAFSETALEGTPFGFALLDAGNALCWHNAAFARMVRPGGPAPAAGENAAQLWQAPGREDFRAYADDAWQGRDGSGGGGTQGVILTPQADAGATLKASGRLVRDGAGRGYLLLCCEPWRLLAALDAASVNGFGLSRESEALMVLAAAPALGQCRILGANREACDRLGDGAPLAGQPLGALAGIDLPPRLWREAETAFATGRAYTTMYTAAASATGFALMQWDFWPVNRQNGRVTHWMDRRRLTSGAPGQLNSDVRWLQLAADALRATDVGLWHWDLRSGNITYSPRLLAQLGYDQAAIGEGEEFLASLYHPEDLPKLRRSVDEAIAGSGQFSHVVRLVDTAGRYHWIAVQGQVILDSDGTPMRLFGTEADVTEETLLRERLLRAERIAKIGNWSMNASPPGMYWSPECYRIHGMDPARFKPSATQMTYLMHPEDKMLLQDAFKRTLRDGAPNCGDHDRFRARIIRGDGEIRHCEWTAIIERDKGGAPSGLVGTIQDITDTVETEKRLVQAQKMEVVGQMAGGVAHDFNNLLAVIVGNLELLEETSQHPGGADLIRSAIEAAKKGAGLTRNLLSFARKATLEPMRIDLNEMVTELDKMLKRVLPRTIELETRFAAGLWPVHADRNSFENALLNLAINARDAMDGSGRLTIETQNVALEAPFLEEGQEDLAPGHYTVVAVSDNGIGMSKAQLAKVFTPFYSTKPPSKGSGLGLPMVQGFAKQSGGGVRVYSEPGLGTTVKLFLPASDAQGAAARQAAEAAHRDVRLEGRILLVEDDPGVSRVLTLRLERMGLTVIAATSGDEALDLFPTSGPVDVLLTDIVMPGALQGPALAERLRRLAPGLRVIFMSGYPKETPVPGGSESAQDIRLMKPISRGDLTKALSRALGAAAAAD